MIILGVDTALRCTGYGVISSDGDTSKVIDCGVIKNPREISQSQCLLRLFRGIHDLAKTFRVEAASIEGAFYGKNVRTTMILGYARGAVMTSLASLNIPIYAYSPKEVKMAAGGTGSASKEQVAIIMSSILGIDISGMDYDATVALGLALCHANRAIRQDSIYTLNKQI